MGSDVMLISLRSPFGGQPLREWTKTVEKGEENVRLGKEAVPIVTDESYYCMKIGYLEDGQAALIKDTEAHRLYKLLKRHYRH